MPDEPRPSVFHHIVSKLGRRGAVAACASVALAVVLAGALYASATSGAAASRVEQAAAPSATPGSDASVLAPLGLLPDFSPADGDDIAAFARFAEAAGQPTATATPEPTPPAPTPTPPAVRAKQAPAAPPPPPPPEPATAPWGLDTSPMDAYSQALFDDTNRRRVESGLPPLRANGYLVGIARIRSQDMADHDYFAHVSPITGDTAFSLMDKHGVQYGWAGENLAKNNYPDDQTVSVADSALWNSPPHRENILNPNYTDMGIALAIDPTGMKYFTIVFIGPP